MRGSITAIFGLPGHGKSYSTVAWLVKEIFSQEVRVVTTLPLKMDAIERFMARRGGLKAQVDMISSEGWLEGMHGPWDCINDTDRFTIFVIDECHKLLPRTGNVDYRKRFGEWLKTVRHEGAEVHLITQVREDFCPWTELLVGEWIQVRGLEHERDPFLGIRMGDWYQLSAALYGVYAPIVVREEVGIGAKGVAEVIKRQRFELDPEIYKLYDSYSVERTGGRSLRKLQPFELHGRLGVFWWFFKRNFFTALWSPASKWAYGMAAIPLVIGYGIPWFVHGLTDRVPGLAHAAVVGNKETGDIASPDSGTAAPLAAAGAVAAEMQAVAIYTFQGSVNGKAIIDGKLQENLEEYLPGAVLRGGVLWFAGLPVAPGKPIQVFGGPSVHEAGAAIDDGGAGGDAANNDRLLGVPPGGGGEGSGSDPGNKHSDSRDARLEADLRAPRFIK